MQVIAVLAEHLDDGLKPRSVQVLEESSMNVPGVYRAQGTKRLVWPGDGISCLFEVFSQCFGGLRQICPQAINTILPEGFGDFRLGVGHTLCQCVQSRCLDD
jgi:hypothetical protein